MPNERILSKRYRTDLHVVRSLVNSLGYNETEAILKMHPSDIRVTARVNLLKTTRKKAIKALKQEGIRALEIDEIPEGIEIIHGQPKLGHSIAYLQGLVTPQGLGSMTTVHILDPKPDELIWDMAAAPGGKTTFIAERMRNRGWLIANDINRARLRAVQANIKRHGITNTIITHHDATDLKLPLQFDKILLDAPCTGEGLLVSQPRRRTSKDISDPFVLQRMQQRLLHNALKHLKPRGTLVYSTCSLNVTENEEVIKPFLNQAQLLKVEMQIKIKPVNSPIFEQAIRLLPSRHGCDGFFIAKLRKKG